jgi:hypothetical protein
MKISTRHMLAQRLIGLVAVILFLGATDLWPIPLVGLLPVWMGYPGLVILFAIIISGLGFGPWGRIVTRHVVTEDRKYREI